MQREYSHRFSMTRHFRVLGFGPILRISNNIIRVPPRQKSHSVCLSHRCSLVEGRAELRKGMQTPGGFVVRMHGCIQRRTPIKGNGQACLRHAAAISLCGHPAAVKQFFNDVRRGELGGITVDADGKFHELLM